jgi:O-antigen/teichoic acid export membrane protein
MPLRPEIAPAAWRRLLRLTAAFAAASSLGALYVYAAQITMSLVASDDEVGFFAASFRIFVVVGAVPGLLVASAFPLLARAARDERERLAYAVRRLFEVSLLAGVIAGLALGIGAPVAIDVAAGAEFAPAVPALRVQSVGLLATFVLAVWGFALISLGAYRALLVANAAAFATSVALTLPLAGPYGATGVAVASVAGELVLGAGYVAGLSRAGRDLRPQGRVPARAGVALVPALGVALVPGLPVLVATVLAVALFAGLAFALRTVPPELAELLPARLRRR